MRLGCWGFGGLEVWKFRWVGGLEEEGGVVRWWSAGMVVVGVLLLVCRGR